MPETRAFAPQFVSGRHRDEAAALGMWVFIATEVLLFGALILGYFVYRHLHPAGFAAASSRTDLVIGTANTAILLTSSFAVAWAVEAFSAETRKFCATLLACAIGLGIAFLVLKSFEYRSEYREHLVPGIDFKFDPVHVDGAQLFFLFYFVATGLHALHMMIGIAVLGVMALLINRTPSARHRTALHSAALYWHFVDVVWIFLFALVYLPGRAA